MNELHAVQGPANRLPLTGPYGRRLGWAYVAADGISVHAELTDASWLDVRGFALKSAVAPVLTVGVAR